MPDQVKAARQNKLDRLATLQTERQLETIVRERKTYKQYIRNLKKALELERKPFTSFSQKILK
jgi:chaperonin cofactor prefoldin